jgi:L-lactate dehydrogenase
MKKITVIGAGNVGSHIVSASIHRNFSAEFILVDLCEKYEHAQFLDLKDALPFGQKTKISQADLGDKILADSDIFIITAGAKQKEGQSRLDLVEENTQILKDISEKIGPLKKTALVILVSNPVDILVQKAQELFNLNRWQVFGTGTLLDSARLDWRLSEIKKNRKNLFDSRPEKVKSFVLGEHGDSSFVP